MKWQKQELKLFVIQKVSTPAGSSVGYWMSYLKVCIVDNDFVTEDSRLMKDTYVITGEYGSGKTEFAVNLALSIRGQSVKPLGNSSCDVGGGSKSTNNESPVYLADLDVINPYFRSREKEAVLKEQGIILTGYSVRADSDQDLPAVSYGFVQGREAGDKSGNETIIIDLAGSENGLKPLEPLYDKVDSPEFLCVVNCYRPLTSKKEGIIKFINQVNNLSRWSITGLVNNSNMLHETDAGHILKGQEILLQVSRELNIPIQFTQLHREIYKQISHEIHSEQIIIFDELQMRESWQ
jgi:hypothetical protein